MKSLLFFSISLLVTSIANSQCVMCKASIELQDGDQTIGGGINEGILYIMPIPYIIMGVIAFLLYKKYKKKIQSNE